MADVGGVCIFEQTVVVFSEGNQLHLDVWVVVESFDQTPVSRLQFGEVAHTPSCPMCGTAMVLRTARKGTNAGFQFWGCPRYPSCRGTRAYPDRKGVGRRAGTAANF